MKSFVAIKSANILISEVYFKSYAKLNKRKFGRFLLNIPHYSIYSDGNNIVYTAVRKLLFHLAGQLLYRLLGDRNNLQEPRIACIRREP